MSDLIFQILVTFVTFLFVCCLQYQPQENTENNSIQEIKEAFSPKFDPEPITVSIPLLPPARERNHNQTEMINNDVIIASEQKVIAFLPPAKVRRHNQTTPIINTVLITEAPKSNKPQLSSDVTLKYLKEYIKEHNLQSLIKEKLGKSYSQGRKDELLKALNF